MRNVNALLLAAAALLAVPAPARPADAADIIYSGGPILTMDDGRLRAEAVAVKDGKIVAVGAMAEVKALAGPATKTVDLAGRTMIPGFVEGVIGMAVGDTKTVACQFPEEYPQEDCRGRAASFVLTLTDLKTKELPELDDAFAQQASDKETFAELRADLEARLQEDAERRDKANRHDALLEAPAPQPGPQGPGPGRSDRTGRGGARNQDQGALPQHQRERQHRSGPPAPGRARRPDAPEAPRLARNPQHHHRQVC